MRWLVWMGASCSFSRQEIWHHKTHKHIQLFNLCDIYHFFEHIAGFRIIITAIYIGVIDRDTGHQLCWCWFVLLLLIHCSFTPPSLFLSTQIYAMNWWHSLCPVGWRTKNRPLWARQMWLLSKMMAKASISWLSKVILDVAQIKALVTGKKPFAIAHEHGFTLQIGWPNIINWNLQIRDFSISYTSWYGRRLAKVPAGSCVSPKICSNMKALIASS